MHDEPEAAREDPFAGASGSSCIFLDNLRRESRMGGAASGWQVENLPPRGPGLQTSLQRCNMRRFVVRPWLALILGAVVLDNAPVDGQDKFLDKITQALPDKAPAQPKQPRKLLIFSKTAGFRHSSIPVGIKAITMMGDKTGAY